MVIRAQEEKKRAKKPRGLIEYEARKFVPPGFARGGPILQQIAQRRYT